MNPQSLYGKIPAPVRQRMNSVFEAVEVATQIHNPKVLWQMIPSATRGFLIQEGKQRGQVSLKSQHESYFDFHYRSDFPEMYELYRRAKQNQWDAERDIDWRIDVDPMNPETVLLPDSFIELKELDDYGIVLTEREVQAFKHSMAAWMLSQFLHGEHGALLAAAQVTESVKWMDGKFYGATQVMDEGRHVEVFHRYLETKLEKVYAINDNLFVIIDALMTDPRWDMKFLGMQIMIEGLALGAFRVLYNHTNEPLLKEILKYVIQDEARHVHYGVLALREHNRQLSEKERREREDWAFEVALLMRNRFMAFEIYEEWFAHKMSRRHWKKLVNHSVGMDDFRSLMFSRLIPNLKAIGLLSKRVRKHYEKAGLLKYADGLDSTQLTADDLLQPLEAS